MKVARFIVTKHSWLQWIWRSPWIAFSGCWSAMFPVWINQSTNGLAGRAHRQHWSRCALGLIEKWVNIVCVCVRALARVCVRVEHTHQSLHYTIWKSDYVCAAACVRIQVRSWLIHPSACVTSPSKLFISVQALPAWIICLPYKYLNVHRSLICTDTVCL